MPRRLLLAVVAVVALVLGLVLLLGGGGNTKRDAKTVAGTTSARSGARANATSRAGLSFLAQRNAPARRLAGRVIFQGQPVAGANVRLVHRARRDIELGSATTGTDGTFDFGAQEATLLLVSANAEGKAGVVLPVDLRNPAMRPPADALVLELRPCVASLYGFILDASSGAIPGAFVRRGPIESVAAADGAYSLCVPIGELNVDVGADGYGTIGVSLPVTNRLRRDFRLSPEGVIAGRAVRADDGKPVADAVITMRPTGGVMAGVASALGGAAGYAKTDVDGRFRLAGVLPGRRQLSAAALGLRSPDVDVNVVAGDLGEEVTIALEPTAVVQGRVVDEAGAAVPGATIMLGDDERARFRDGEAMSAVSQLDGAFVLEGVLPGTYVLDIAPFHGAKGTPRMLEVPAAGLSDLALVVARGSTISGVVTRSGKPLGGARVYVQGGGRMQALSEPDGRYTIRGVAPGNHALYAESLQDGAFNRGPTLTVEKGKDLTGVDIELALAGSIAGVVVDQHGAPVSGAYLSFQLVKGNDFGESTTAEDGTFEARALSGGGEYSVSIMASRRSSMKFAPTSGDDFPPVAVADGDTHITGVRYAVTVDRLSISGKVADEKGQPMPDVRVEATPRGERGWDWGEIPSSVTDADGTFAIANLLAGDYHVDARAGNGAVSGVDKPVAAGAKNVTITLSTPGTIEGTLEGFDKPPKVVARMFRRNGPPEDPLTAEVTGTSFRIRGAPPGSYMVMAISGGIASARKPAQVEAAQTARVTLTNLGAGVLEGTVTDTTGKPIRGARCSMADFATPQMSAMTDDQGAFAIRPAPVGQHHVFCHSMESMAMGHGPATVVANETATITITIAVREEPKPKSTIGATFAKTPAGPRVAALVDGGPAAKAGMKIGDVVVAIDPIEVSLRDVDGTMIDQLVGHNEPGTTMTFRLRRGTETLEVAVTTAPLS